MKDTFSYIVFNKFVILLEKFFSENSTRISRTTVRKAVFSTSNYPLVTLRGFLNLFISFGFEYKVLPLEGTSFRSKPMFIIDPGDSQIKLFRIATDGLIIISDSSDDIKMEEQEFRRNYRDHVIVAISIPEGYEHEEYSNDMQIEHLDRQYYLNNHLTVIDDFLSAEQCQDVIESCEKKNAFSSSLIKGDGQLSSRLNIDTRISSSYYINEPTLDVQEAIQKAADTVGKPKNNVENAQCVRYRSGQFFKFHFDAAEGLDREFTLLVYLNEGFEGGKTVFPELEYSVIPKVGRALVFKNLDEKGQIIVSSLHAGEEVISGTKYALNLWIRR